MSQFNYTNLHFFDKHGIELPITYSSNYIAEIINESGDNAVFYGLKDCSTGEFEFIKKKAGNRFPDKSEEVCHLTIGNTTYETTATVVKEDTPAFIGGEQTTVKYVNEISDIVVSDDIQAKIDALPFPTITLSSSLSLPPVSVDLVETQSIYVLCEYNNAFAKLAEVTGEDIIDFKNHYKILFYLDNRSQKDFRFFSVDNSELKWSDRAILNFNKGDFKVNIGFCGAEEGIYEQIMYVCILKDYKESDPTSGEIYPIGSIKLEAEAIGEDERYRTLFSNFGIPDPIHYQEVFANTSLDEGKMDYMKLNENSKKLFLSYSEIFSYIGSYKALMNAVNVLGYHDIFFKEWYKETGKNIVSKGYVTYDMSYKSDANANIIDNIPIEERISLKKLNWLSMVYRINKELLDEAEDQWGFPQIIEIYDYNNEEIITKLYSLKKWLEKYIIGLNCKIIDVSGEGIYFERYKLDTYGMYQQVFDWNNSNNLIPTVVTSDENGPLDYYLIDSSAYLNVDIGLYNAATIEDYKNYTLEQFCDGYIGTDNIYHQRMPDDEEAASVYVGRTFECLNRFEDYELKATSYGEDFLFGKEYLAEDSAGIRIHDNEIYFNPFELLEKEQQAAFTLLPFIQLEKANIRKKETNWNNSVKYRINPELTDDSLESYTIKNLETGDTYSSTDYIMLIPPTYSEMDDVVTITSFSGTEIEKDVYYVPEFQEDDSSLSTIVKHNQTIRTYGLRYSAINKMNMPLFSIVGYEVDGKSDFIDLQEEYYIEILDGKMLFNDVEHDRKIFLNFNFDKETNEQEVKISIIYTSDNFKIESYEDEDYIPAFIPGNEYSTFVDNYENDIDNAIIYDNVHSIKVMNTGEFTIDVYAKDLQNNIFAKNCENTVNVYLPNFSINTYTNSSNSGEEHNSIAEYISEEERTFLRDNYTDFCIYNNAYMIDGFVKTINDSSKELSIQYPSYSYSMHNPKGGDYLHFMNISDRYYADAVEFEVNSTLDKTYTGYFMVLEKNGINAYTRVIEESDSPALLAISNDIITDEVYSAASYMSALYSADSNLDYTDVNLILYNNLGNYPIMQTYASMVNANAIPYSDIIEGYTDGKYRLLIGEYSERSYIWASLLEHIEQDIPKIINHYIDDASSEMIIIPDDSSFNDDEEESQEDEVVIEEPTEEDIINDWYYIEPQPSDFLDVVVDFVENLKTVNITVPASKIEEEELENTLADFKESLENIIDSSAELYTYEDETLFDTSTEVIDYIKSKVNDLYYTIGDVSSNLYVDTKSCVCLNNYETYDTLMNIYLKNILINEDDTDTYGIKYILGEHNDLYSGTVGEQIYAKYKEDTNLAMMMSNAKITDDIIKQVCSSITNALKVRGNNIAEMHRTFIEDFYSNYGNITSAFTSAVEVEYYEDDELTSAYSILFESGTSKNELRSSAQKIILHTLERLETYPDEDIIQLQSFIPQYSKILFAICVYIADCTFYNMQDIVDYKDTALNCLYAEYLGTYRDDVIVLSYENTLKVAGGLYNTFFTDNGKLDVNSALIEEYDMTNVSEFKLYEKILYNLTSLTAKFLSDKWVTKNNPKNEYDVLYAVAGIIASEEEEETENSESNKEETFVDNPTPVSENEEESEDEETASLYYVKPKGNVYEGLLYTNPVNTVTASGRPISKVNNKNVLPDITALIQKPYISVYIQPTWKAQVSISLITPENAIKLGFIQNEDEYEEIENKYLCIMYSNSDFMWHFRKGEMIKLIFESLTNKEYIGQSSYEVVGYDTEEQVVIVKGAINAAYARKEKREVWAELLIDDPKFPQADIDKLNEFANATNVDERKVEPLIRTYRYMIGNDSPAETTYRLPIKKLNGTWYYKVFYFVNGIPRPIETVKIDPQEKVNMYISYAHNAFVDYTMTANKSKENSNGTTDLSIDYNILNCRKMQFIDDTFVVYAKEFDINEGLAAWMNSTVLNEQTVGEISKKTIYKYRSENGFVPIKISPDSPNVAFTVNFEDMGIDFEESYVQWKVYRKLPTNNEREYMFESFNKVLYLDYVEPGIYDIEANVFDKYGNTATKVFKGAYKVTI